MTAYNFTLRSENAKTGPIPVTMTSGESCPESCAFNGKGCYAQSGPLAFVWNQLGKPATHKRAPKSLSLAELCERIAALPEGQVWRHNQAGDLPGDGDVIDGAALGALVEANRGKRGFTYSHKPVLYARHGTRAMDHAVVDNAVAIAAANAEGFTVNLSANNLEHADELSALGIAPVVTVLPADVQGNVKVSTPAGRAVAVCPATYDERVTCASCQLCQRQGRKVIVGFPAHGNGKTKASAIARGE